MKDWKSQAHVKWECLYHVVIVPKYRRKIFFGESRKKVADILRQLCRQKEIALVAGNAMPDRVHMVLNIPPKYRVAMTLGQLKGKSAIRIHWELMTTKGTLFGRKFWSRGYCVSTVGLDEQRIRTYVREQEHLDKQLEQGELNLDQ